MYGFVHNQLPVIDQQVVEEHFVTVTGDIGCKTYKKGRVLGRGGFAEVIELKCNDTGKVSAAKIIPKSAMSKPRARHKLMAELKIHRSLHHDNVLRLNHFFEDPSNFYILLEVCSNETFAELLQRRKRLTEVETRCLMYQVLSGLQYIHSNHVVHRDLKGNNILLAENMQVKIGDFGVACKLEFAGERKRTFCGTPNYIAPEILEGRAGHSYEADVWSVGVIAYTLALGYPPFNAHSLKKIYSNIKTCAYTFPSYLELSESFKQFISDVLVLDYQDRPSAVELLNHPFFMTSPFPALLPVSSLVAPPPSSFLDKYNEFHQETPARAWQVQKLRSEISPRVRSPLRSQQPTRKSIIVSKYVPVAGHGPQVWVSMWIDYSAKYGLGYLLSNKNCGLYLNDSSKLLQKRQTLLYQPQGASSATPPQEYSMDEFPKEAAKKLSLLMYFKKHLASEQNSQSDDDVWILKWITTPQCVIYRLSDKTVQAYFNDKTEVIMCESKEVVYVNKRRHTSFQSIGEIGPSTELGRRVNYVKEAFQNILSAPSSPRSPNRQLSKHSSKFT